MIKKLFLILLIPFVLFAQNANFQNKYRLAQTYERNEQYNKAENLYRELHNMQPNNMQVNNKLNNLLVQQKKYNESINFLDEMIVRFPGDVNYYGMLGSTYHTMDNREKAEEIWDRGLAANPGSAATYRILANFAVKHRNFDKAIEYLEKGKNLPNVFRMFTYDIAQIYYLTMRYDAATKEYCEILLRDPKQINIVRTRINQYVDGHDAFQQIEKVLKEYSENTGNSIFTELISNIYMRTGRYDEAFELLVSIPELKANTMYSFARDAYREEEFEIASAALTWFIEHYPDAPSIPSARNTLAAALKGNVDTKLGKNKESWKPLYKKDTTGAYLYHSVIEVYNEISAQFPNTPVAYTAYYSMADLYVNELIDYKKADSVLSIITSEAPLSKLYGDALLLKAQIAIKQDDLELAQKFLKQTYTNVRVSDETKSTAKYLAGKILLWQQHADKAVEMLVQVTDNSTLRIVNDALEYAMIINTFKQDSVNFAKFAEADYLANSGKFNEASEIFRQLAQDPSLIVLNEIAEYNYAITLLAENKYQEAIKIFDNIVGNNTDSIYSDYVQFLKAETYRLGLHNETMAKAEHQKLLESFPNSLYLDKSRKILNDLSNKSKI